MEMRKMKIEARNYAGTRDWMGQDAWKRKKVTDTVVQVLELYGFEALETPIIELAEVLKGKYGDEGNQLTYFFNKGGTELGLRYDQTVPLARVVAQYPDLTIPYRRFAIGPVFRADKPQAGRFRQFTQIDFDVVGISSVLADAEVCAINNKVLTSLGFNNFQIQICDRRLLNSMAKLIGAKTENEILAILRSWDKIEKTDRSQIATELSAVEIRREVIDSFNKVTDQLLAITGTNREILSEIKRVFSNEDVDKNVDILRQLSDYISDFGVPEKNYRINPCLARGLTYYTGPIFETVIKGGIGSITGGGRFDNLIESLGGPSLPATGSSFGLERILGVMTELEMSETKQNQIDVFVTVFDPGSEESVRESIEISTTLRAAYMKVEMAMDQQKLGKQLKLADKRGAKVAIIVGPEEKEKNMVVIKNLKKSAGGSKENQIMVKRYKVTDTIRKMI